MRDPEMEMAMALEGKFFWDPSRDPESQSTPLELAIKNAQKQFYATKPIQMGATSLEDVAARVERIVKMVKASNAVTKESDPFVTLRKIVAFCYGVSPERVNANTNSNEVAGAKHHFHWTALRQFNSLSLAEIARQIGRHHSAIIHSRDKFEKMKRNCAVEIEIVDRAAEALGCGF